MSEEMTPLSRLGEKRREEILARALGEARRRKSRRVGRRAGVVCLLGGAMLVMVWHSWSEVGVRVMVKGREFPMVERPAFVSRIETDPDIVRRLALPERATHVEMIRDEQLLNELAAAHEPAGLAYVDGKAVLMFR